MYIIEGEHTQRKTQLEDEIELPAQLILRTWSENIVILVGREEVFDMIFEVVTTARDDINHQKEREHERGCHKIVRAETIRHGISRNALWTKRHYLYFLLQRVDKSILPQWLIKREVVDFSFR